MPAKLSVILPNFNHARFLNRSITALLQQSLPAYEILCVDDGSTDESISILEDYAAKHENFSYLTTSENQGTVKAVRRALDIASGEYLYFASADDMVLPEFFSQSISCLEKHPGAPFSTGLTQIMEDDGTNLGLLPTPRVSEHADYLSPSVVHRKIMAHGPWFRCNTAIYRKKNIEEANYFNPDLKAYGDGFLCMTLALQKGCCFIPNPVCSMRVGDDNQSSQLTSDPVSSAEVFETARHLMETKYSDLYTREFIRRWDARWRLAIAEGTLSKHGTKMLTEVKALTNQRSVLTTAIFGLCQIMPRLPIRFLMAYLRVSMTPRDVFKAIARRFNPLNSASR